MGGRTGSGESASNAAAAAQVSGSIWTKDRVVEALGISESQVGAMLDRHDLLALAVMEGENLAFPRWQFVRRPEGRGWQVISGLADVLHTFAVIGERAVDCWTIAGWFRSPGWSQKSLPTPLELLQAGNVASALEAAQGAAERWTQ